LGSGVIVTTDGYILTANHVVEGADEVKVALASGDKEFTAKVIGNDPLTDIAVLKIDVRPPLPAITLTDSEKLEVGDMVLAIGNPFGVGQTVTMGLVSATQRGGFGITGYENFIQTDAAINPGNSGGALVDAEGRLVGINTAIISPSGGFNGIGFAVPINMARFVMERLIQEGKVRRGYLGISIQPLTPELAKEFGLPDESSGVLVGGVTPGGSAAKAGVRDGDVVVEINGTRVRDMRNLQLLVAQAAPGSKINLKLLRSEGRGRKAVEKTIAATLAELPAEELFGSGRARGQQQPEQPTEYDALDGVEVSDLDARTRRQLSLPNQVSGALVSNIDPNSNAAEAGLRPGDVILEIDRQPVKDAQAAVKLSENAKGDRILLRVYSGTRGGPGATRYLTVANTKKK
jgi:serine protease Do